MIAAHSAPLRSLCDVNKASISTLSARTVAPELRKVYPLNLKRTLPRKAIQRLEVPATSGSPANHGAASA